MNDTTSNLHPEQKLDSIPAQPAPATPAAKLTRAEAVAMTMLGVDWGAARMGLAVKPAGQDWALPRAVLRVRSERDSIDSLRREIAAAGAGAVVVGLPLDADGEDTEQSRVIKKWCRKAREGMTGVRWCFVDETLTTQAAETLNREAEGDGPADDLAAKLILDAFLARCPAAPG